MFAKDKPTWKKNKGICNVSSIMGVEAEKIQTLSLQKNIDRKEERLFRKKSSPCGERIRESAFKSPNSSNANNVFCVFTTGYVNNNNVNNTNGVRPVLAAPMYDVYMVKAI